MTTPCILTIILNYRTADMTLKSAEAALTAMQGLNGKILIVDNDSQDGSFEKIHAGVQEKGWAQNQIEVVQSGHNGGFGAGNNYAMRLGFSGALDCGVPDYFYILNSDAFPNETTISALADHLSSNLRCGFAGSHIINDAGEAERAAFRFPTIAGEFEGAVRFGPVSRLLKKSIVALPLLEQTQSVDWIAGASLMMRADTLKEIGLFDESFFLYFEETDLCLRANRAGWSVDFVRESEIMHIGSVSTGMKTWNRIPQFWLDSRLHYFVQNHGVVYASLASFVHLLGGALARLRCVLQRKSSDQPKYFLIDLAIHGAKAVFRKAGLKQRNITFPKAIRPADGGSG